MNIFPVHISFLISHVATATLLLRKKICPRKSYSNLKQLILFRLLSNFAVQIRFSLWLAAYVNTAVEDAASVTRLTTA